jgi:uncharacterized protein YkuJ
MKIIKEQLKYEKLKDNPDLELIDKLQNFLDTGSITIEAFQDTGNFICSKSFKTDRPDVTLRSECVDVITYLGGPFIQSMRSGKYLVEINDTQFDDKDLVTVEQFLVIELSKNK